MSAPLVLASGSAGRQELLRRTGISFTVDASDVDESTDAASVEEHVQTLALRKARSVAARNPEAIVIGADTVAELDGTTIGKPESGDDAKAMLRLLSGHYHRLLSGLAVLGPDGRAYCGLEVTRVHMRVLSDDEIDAYVESGEPLNKSGCYEIQGLGAAIIDRIEGDFANVVGLPMAHLAGVLKTFGIRIPGETKIGVSENARI
ncbi:MAG: Maf family protein [Chloroflexota bacterium]